MAGRPAYRVQGRLLTEQRVLKLQSQEEAADQIGITRGALARAEAGGPVRLETIKAIATYYGLHPADVLDMKAA